MIGTVTMNPSVDHHATVRELKKDDALRAESVAWFAGGKGINVARVVHALGGQARAFGFVGGFPGKMLTGWLDQAGIPHSFLEIAGETRINTTIRDLSDNTETHVRAAGPRVGPAELDKLCAALCAQRPAPAYWVLGGSLPPGAPDDFYETLIVRLEKTGARCVLDADDEALAQGLRGTPFLIKPNEHEFERLTGRPPGSDPEIVRAARPLIERGTGVVLVTLGPRGAVAVTGTEAFRIDTPKVQAKSKVGAGDATIAGLLVALERGAQLPEAIRYGIAVGTAAVMSEGTAQVRPRDVEGILPRIGLTEVQ